MSDLDIIRAWKDEVYRASLSVKEQAHLPKNPAGAIELTEDELQGVDAGFAGTSASMTTTVTYDTANYNCGGGGGTWVDCLRIY